MEPFAFSQGLSPSSLHDLGWLCHFTTAFSPMDLILFDPYNTRIFHSRTPTTGGLYSVNPFHPVPFFRCFPRLSPLPSSARPVLSPSINLSTHKL